MFSLDWFDPLTKILRLKRLLSIEYNSVRLGVPAHEIVIKTVHKTLQRGRWGGD